jgi:hypothetical protein
MLDIETTWRIVGPGAAFLIATGFAMVRFDEFVAARVLFWLAVVIFTLQQFAWQLVTTTPWWFRLPAGALTGIAVFVVFPILVGWLRTREINAGTSRRNTSAEPPLAS